MGDINASISNRQKINAGIKETLLKGASAYEMAVQEGYVGTEEEWLASLHGTDGHTPEITSTKVGTREHKLYADGVEFASIFDGFDGADGEKGDKGDPGETGPQGPKGDKGDKGDTGATGPQGTKGDTGETGPQGPKGDTGETGATGAMGPQGPQGIQGPSGSDGADGFSPTATVSKSGSTATITITDKNGTTTVEIHDGQGGTGTIDPTPTEGSTNAVSSGGVYDELSDLKSDLYQSVTPEYTKSPGYIGSEGNINSAGSGTQEVYTSLIPLDEKKLDFAIDYPASNSVWCAYALYDANQTFIKRVIFLNNITSTHAEKSIDLTSENAQYISLTWRTYGTGTETISVQAHTVRILKETQEEMLTDLDKINNVLRFPLPGLSVDYTGSLSSTRKSIFPNITLYGGRTYKITVIFPATNTASGYCGVSKLDNTSPDYASVALVNKEEASFLYSPESDLDCNITVRLSPSATYSFTCTVEDVTPNSIQDLYNKNETIENDLVDSTGFTYTKASGYIGANGNILSPSKAEVYTSLIPIAKGTKIHFTLQHKNPHTNWCAYGLYDENENFIERVIFVDTVTSDYVSEVITLDTGASYVSFTWRTYNDGIEKLTSKIYDMQNTVLDKLTEVADTSKLPALNIGMLKPCYDHLFVNRKQIIDIPSESLFHVRVSKALGFNMIEANVQTTSDGVLFVHHMDTNRTFGTYFVHVDGTTDISNIVCTTVTWAWIEENVRYNTRIAKYKTRPALLSEFLAECKKQGLYVFITAESQAIVDMARAYMGKDMFIAYSATRELCPTEIIYKWRTTETTKAEILSYCKSIGAPMIYGMARPYNFTDEQLKEIVKELHDNGFYIGTSYQDADWHRYAGLGFDFNGTQESVNRIESGNLYNYSAMYGFDDFTYTNATETDGVLTFTADGTFNPNVSNTVYSLCMIDIELLFDGEITIPKFAEVLNPWTVTSDGKESVYRAIPIVHSTASVTVNVKSGTKIYDAKFKASSVLD